MIGTVVSPWLGTASWNLYFYSRMTSTKPPAPEQLADIYRQACALHQNGQHPEAEAQYAELLALFPESAALHYNMGLLLYQQERYSESLDHYLQALEGAEDDVDLLHNLALCLKKCGKIRQAILVFTDLTVTNPLDLDCLYNLACCHKDLHQHDQAIEVYRRLLAIDPDYRPAINNLAYLLHLRGDLSEARSYYERLLQLDPDHQAARHMLASVQGERVAQPPVEYVKKVFNNYAADYETSLVDVLNYSVPQKLRQALAGLEDLSLPFDHALDLGCGTGLAGVAFADCCRRLTGVDLAEEMVARATEKGLYTDLVVAESVEFLRTAEDCYDLVLLTDVMIYLGDLLPFFAALGNCTREKSLLCFSVETSAGEDFTLQPTGRFAHSTSYITALAEHFGWKVVVESVTDLRKEGQDWLAGALFVMVKDAAA